VSAPIERLPRSTGVLLSCLAILAGFCLLASSARAAGGAENYGIESVGASLSTTQAGAHPDFTQTLKLKTNPASTAAWAGTREVKVEVPPGLIGNPTSFPACSVSQFTASSTAPFVPCPFDSQIGLVNIDLFLGGTFSATLAEPLYNLPAAKNAPARLGFIAVNTPVFIEFTVRSGGDYGLTATAHAATDFFVVNAVETTIWGVPGDPSHDEFRMTPIEAENCGFACGAPNGHSRESGLGSTPFMTNPTSCIPGQEVNFTTTSYALPGESFHASAPFPAITGCDKLPFSPTMSLKPDQTAAESPSGMEVHIGQSQAGLENANTLAPADLRKVVATLPDGVRINPSAASGLDGCSEAQIGLQSTAPITFDEAPPSCPDGSKIGTARIDTPLLKNPLIGSLYVARQGENPFGSLLAGYLVVEGEGVIVKLAGRFDLDQATGQVTATFDENPQQPFTNLELNIRPGSRGPLTTPTACGSYTTQVDLYSWGGQVVHRESGFTIGRGPNGGPCPNGQFSPGFTAGTTNPTAGSYAPFELRVTRQDGEENLSSIETTLPEGLLAKLAGVPLCGDASAASGDCGSTSQIGTVTAAAGSGATPVYLPQPGKAPTALYLAGPYKGAPYSVVAKVPAQAGPFDLGTVVVRSGLYVDPMTTQVTVKSDPLPQILDGIPITYRDVRVAVDKSGFTLNPTSCNPMTITSRLASSGGKIAAPSSRFQAASCGSLAFKPAVALSLKGSTKRTGHPALTASVTYPKNGQFANIARAQINLPHSEFLDQGNLNKTCTRPVLLEGKCPAKSIYGKAKAWTPLLDKPLEGSVYLVGGFGYKLPALVAELNGQIRVLLVGKVDTGSNHGIRNTFEAVPDAPVERFVLEMRGGKKYGLLENSENLCKKPQLVKARFTAQSEQVAQSEPKISNDCGKHKTK
jgi:hypothetical protein